MNALLTIDDVPVGCKFRVRGINGLFVKRFEVDDPEAPTHVATDEERRVAADVGLSIPKVQRSECEWVEGGEGLCSFAWPMRSTPSMELVYDQ